MPGDINQRGQAVQGNAREATANGHNERTYSNRVRSLPPSHVALLTHTLLCFLLPRRQCVHHAFHTNIYSDGKVNSEPSETYYNHSARSTSNSATIESGSTSSAQAYYAMQRWAEETPKEQPWNGLEYIVSSNKKDENGNGK